MTKVIEMNPEKGSEEQLTPEQIEAQNEEVRKAFLENKENKQRAANLAYQIKQELTNWFSIPQLIKKFKTTEAEAAKQIEMLMLFNVCIGKVEKNKPYFKIDLDQRTQRTLLMEEIAFHEGKISFLKEKLTKLN